MKHFTFNSFEMLGATSQMHHWMYQCETIYPSLQEIFVNVYPCFH